MALARIAVASLAISAFGVAVTASPASADYNCDGNVTADPPGDKVWKNFPINVKGVVYGHYSLAMQNSISEENGYEFAVEFAVKDSRADGLAPYINPVIKLINGRTIKFGRIENHLSAAGGWRCGSMAGLSHIASITISGSVANAPSIPEPVLVEFSF